MVSLSTDIRMSNSTRHQSYSKFQQVPPPLPPLDHPAFQTNEFGVLPTAIPSAFHADKVTVVRPSHSLPSFRKRPRSSNKADSGMHTIRTRHRSKSTVADNQRPDLAIRNAFHHFRTSSKTSIDSIRRSSAEYSAKQASSLEHDGCWEVGVSKAMINLSLRDQRTRASASTLTAGTADAFHDRPCGENVGALVFWLSLLSFTFLAFIFLFSVHLEDVERSDLNVGFPIFLAR